MKDELLLDGEVWKDIPGYEGLYQVSSLGRFKKMAEPSTDKKKRNTKYRGRDRLLKYKALNDGYERVNLIKDFETAYLRAHRIIAEVFVPNPENKPHVNHRNGIRNDNRLENLEWVTHQENIQHAHDTGLCNPALGEQNGKSKLKKREAIQIKALLNKSNLSISAIGRLYGMSFGCVNRIRKKQTWTHASFKDYVRCYS